MDRPQTITNRGYGSALALPIWVDFMEEAAKYKYEAKPFPRSELATVELCRSSGSVATLYCRDAATAYLVELPKNLAPSETPAFAGVDESGNPVNGPVMVGTEDIPVAPAVPVNGESGRYRVIRKQNGFIFQNKR
jgi:membrane carboxypeptidase/penicillin-binding protein